MKIAIPTNKLSLEKKYIATNISAARIVLIAKISFK